MTIVVNHSTPADGSFSSTGAAAWNANHTLSGVGTLAEQNANAVAITGGAINGTTVGVTTPASGAFTTLSATTPLLISSGGTSATSANAAFNKLSSYQTYVNSASPNLDSTTAQNVFFTGTGTGCYLPDITTLPIGYSLHIVNQTNAAFLVSDFNSTSLYQMPINTGAVFVYVGLGSSTQWTYSISDLWSGDDGVASGNTGITGTGKVVLQSAPAISNATSISIQNAGASGGLQMIRNSDAATASTRTYYDSSTSVACIYNSSGNLFFNTNATIGGSAGSNQMRVSPTASAVNYVNITGAATTGGATPANVTITGTGTDTNVNLVLATKGTGTIKFGTYTAGLVSQAGYVTITDSGGTTRRLLVG